MARKLNPNEIVSFDEILMSEVSRSEALINLLDRKGIITKQELLEDMKKVQADLPKSEGQQIINTNKPRSVLTESDAVDIFNKYIEQDKPCVAMIYSVTDSVPKNCHAYAIPQKDCWYVVCSSAPSSLSIICSSRIIAISKATGEVIYDGLANDEG